MSERLASVAHRLKTNGVRMLFGVPGSGLSLRLITALEDVDIPFFGVAHEAAGVMMAGGVARVTGLPGCAIAVKGPGFANMLPGIVANHFDQVPVLTIAEAYAPGDVTGRMHKRLDHAGMAEPCVKAYASEGFGNATVEELLETSIAEVPGPVHLDLHGREEVDAVLRVAARSVGQPRDSTWKDIRVSLERSSRPVVLVGALAQRQPWGLELSKLRVPVMSTLAAKGVVNECSPWAAGIYTGVGGPDSPEQQILPEADLVVGLGLRDRELLSPCRFPGSAVFVDSVGPDECEGAVSCHKLFGAQAEHFDEILTVLSGKQWGKDLVTDTTERVRRRLVGTVWLPGAAFEQIEGIKTEDVCLVVDTGSFCTIAEHVWRARKGRSFVASANGRYMGTSVPVALGVALARSPCITVVVAGDGGIRSYLAELKLARETNLPLLVVLMTDGRYASIATAPSARGLSRHATTVASPSWHQVISALDFEAFQVRSQEEFESALKSWSGGPAFIEAVFEAELYAAMTRDIR